MINHETLLRTPAFLTGGDTPLILRCMEQEFVEVLLEQLGDDDQWAALREKLLPTAKERAAHQKLKLHLPVHQCFNLVVMEICCDEPGYPRLDPAKIESAGMVVRRHPTPTSGPQRYLHQGSKTLGWKNLTVDDTLIDPDPKRRPHPTTGLPELDKLMENLHQKPQPAEMVSSLFVAPPAVCAAAGRTLLFGVVPVTDSHPPESATPATSAVTATDVASARLLLPLWLKRSSPVPAIPSEIAGHTLRVHVVGRVHQVQVKHVGAHGHVSWSTLKVPPPGNGGAEKLEDFIRMLWFLRIELDAFAETAEAKSIQRLLNEQSLSLKHGSIRMGDFLKKAAKILLRAELGEELEVPAHWTAFPASKMDALATAAYQALRKRAAAATGDKSRFGAKSAEYHLRVFVRVRRPDGCPPVIRWSKPSAHFQIARWYDPAPDGARVPQIELPDIDRNFLENLRPNIAFKVPKPLFNLLRNNAPGDFLKNEGTDNDSGFDFMWICSFSIPIITIVAFILLMVFVIVLNLLFWWLPFVRICIPLPGALAREIGED